jgi:hypothetical protein
MAPSLLSKTESLIMRREPISKLQRLQLASARQKLRIDTAKAKELEESVDPDVKRNQFGRAIVAYEDMPELQASDRILLHTEFERLACPHWAVAKYRPGFGPKNDLRKLSRDSWYFYETGQAILRALIGAVIDEKIPDLLDQLSTDNFNVTDAFNGLLAYLELEDAAKKEAVILHRTTVEKLEVKDKAELAKIRKSLDLRYDAIHKRNAERDNRPAVTAPKTAPP